MAGIHSNGPALAATAPYKGRAFTVGTVTVSKGVEGQGGPAHHCLPAEDYAKMLRVELVKAFKNSGLEQGKGPAIPVNVELTQVYFTPHHFFTTANPPQLSVNVSFGNITTPSALLNNASHNTANNGPKWTYAQRLIPAMAIKLTRNMSAVQKGKRYAQVAEFGRGSEVLNYWSPGSWYSSRGPYKDIKTYGIVVPMAHSAMAQATGQTAAQLDASCKANMK